MSLSPKKHTADTARIPAHRRPAIPQPAPAIPTLSESVTETVYASLIAAKSPDKIQAAIEESLQNSGYKDALRQYIHAATRKELDSEGYAERLKEKKQQHAGGLFGTDDGLKHQVLTKTLEEARKGLPSVLLPENLDSEAQKTQLRRPTGELLMSKKSVDDGVRAVRHELWRTVDLIGVTTDTDG